MPSFYSFSIFLLKMLFKLLTRPRAIGRENMPAQGPVLIVANHMSNVDPPLMGIFIDRKVKYMAKEELFRRRFIFFGLMLRSYGAFPIHKSRTDLDALRKANQALVDGHLLMVFPEGKRSKTGQLEPALPGPALIASRAGAPILPVGITGTERVSRDIWFLRRPRLTVRFGKPFYLPPVTGKLTKEELAKRSDCIMRQIKELLPPAYHGVYSGEGVAVKCRAELTAPSAKR
ncbi:MAG: 1-acyl-sn-glycerol-3-phosphate acyltransferase [Chloroflexi bacterium]|nr:1-acyl-sn-glycerol-3-phosphate acyltransferase [Chloroflexota bacterium]